VNLGDIDDAEDVAGWTGLDEQAEVEGTMRPERAGAKNIRRRGPAVVVARVLGRPSVLHLEAGLNVLEQARLGAKDWLGIVVKVRVGIGPRGEGSGQQEGEE
jgi:hypothetical protein